MMQEQNYIFMLFAHDESMETMVSAKIENPRWDQLETHIKNAFQHGGRVRLEVLHPDDSYVKEIVMDAIPSQFRIVILTRDENPKNELLEWWEEGSSSFRGMVQIGDDDWDARTVGSDVRVAEKIFKNIYSGKGFELKGFGEFRSQWDPRL